MATDQLTPEMMRYMEEKRINQLFEFLYHETLLTLPADPVAHLLTLLRTKPVPRIVLSGPPAGGKGTQCERIVQKYGVVHVSTGDLLRAELQKGSAVGKQAQTFMNQGSLVPDHIVLQIVKDRLSQQDCKSRGWLLDGFPRTRVQALALQQLGVIPSCVIILDVPDEVVVGRIEGRRTDPKTGKVYHMVTNPPPAGLEVVQRGDDTATAIIARLALYHTHLTDIRACYASVCAMLDGDRDPSAIAEDISQHIDGHIGV